MDKEQLFTNNNNIEAEKKIYDETFNLAMNKYKEVAHHQAVAAVLKLRYKATVKEIIEPQQVVKYND